MLSIIVISTSLAVQNHQFQMFMKIHESAFLEKYATRPVLDRGHSFYITEKCSDLYKDDMFKALDKKMIYEKTKELSESNYTVVRKFIAEHAICIAKDLRKFKMPTCPYAGDCRYN